MIAVCVRTRFSLACAALWLAAGVVLGQPQQQPQAREKESTSEWARGNRMLLGVTQESVAFSAQWRFDRAANGDIRIEKEELRAGQPSAGTLIIVGNAAFGARDLQLERGRELDAVNGPILMLQLVLRLLERALPDGPKALTRETRIELSDPKAGIKVTGLGADGEFFAPWALKGVAAPAAGGAVKFELRFASASRGQPGRAYVTSITGIWENTASPLALPDATPLTGWRVYQLRQVVKPRGTINTVGLGTSAPMAFPTLGDLRRKVVEWTDDQARRARYQCN